MKPDKITFFILLSLTGLLSCNLEKEIEIEMPVTHMEKSYYDFYNSVTGSINANSNPFGQPGKISSNIRGSDKVIGIFTGINQSQIVRKIEK